MLYDRTNTIPIILEIEKEFRSYGYNILTFSEELGVSGRNFMYWKDRGTNKRNIERCRMALKRIKAKRVEPSPDLPMKRVY